MRNSVILNLLLQGNRSLTGFRLQEIISVHLAICRPNFTLRQIFTLEYGRTERYEERMG